MNISAGHVTQTHQRGSLVPRLSANTQFDASNCVFVESLGTRLPLWCVCVTYPTEMFVLTLSFSSPQGDLPPFIARMIEAVSAHVNWCDFVLQNNPSLTPDARDNLLKQKANIAQQLNLVNDQVNLYRVSEWGS